MNYSTRDGVCSTQRQRGIFVLREVVETVWPFFLLLLLYYCYYYYY